MIDLESLLYSRVVAAVRAKFPKIFTTREAVSKPATFPCLSMVEMNNATYRRSLTAEQKEHHANLAYQFEAFSNLITGKKSQCRAIMAVVDDVMIGLNFTRTMLEPVENLPDASLYRIVARYTAVASTDGMIYRK